MDIHWLSAEPGSDSAISIRTFAPAPFNTFAIGGNKVEESLICNSRKRHSFSTDSLHF